MVPDDFQSDPRFYCHLVAGNAKCAFGKLIEFDHATMDHLTGFFALRVELYLVVFIVLFCQLDTRSIGRSNDRRVDRTGFHSSLTIVFTVSLNNSVAGNAGYPFSKDPRAVPNRLIPAKFHRRGNGRVASQAKVSNGALSQIVDSLFELVKHRRYRCVGVAGHRPFTIDLLVAGFAFGR